MPIMGCAWLAMGPILAPAVDPILVLAVDTVLVPAVDRIPGAWLDNRPSPEIRSDRGWRLCLERLGAHRPTSGDNAYPNLFLHPCQNKINALTHPMAGAGWPPSLLAVAS